MKQDYVYLIEYAKLFAMGAIKADSLDTMSKFSKVLDYLMNGEMGLHQNYAEQLSISRSELESTKPTPTNIAYTRYMLNVAHTGSLADLVAVMLPCSWGYQEIGSRLAKQYPDAINHPFYGDWVRMYSSEDFAASAQWKIDLLDELSAGKPERELMVIEEHFVQASRFEYMFWDMSYQREDWPV